MDPIHDKDEYQEDVMHGVIRGDDILVGDINVTNQFLNESGEGDESLNTQGRSSGEVDAHTSGEGGIGGSNEEEADRSLEVHIVGERCMGNKKFLRTRNTYPW